jgi:hypothetical protein
MLKNILVLRGALKVKARNVFIPLFYAPIAQLDRATAF